MAEIAIIAAVAQNGVIGHENQLPWKIPADLKRFRKLTLGQPVIMGRKTWQAIYHRNKKPLQKRTNIVVSRQKNLALPIGVLRAQNPIHAAQIAEKSLRNGQAIWIIGGAEIYAAFMEQASSIYLTEIRAKPQGDAFFPTIDPNLFAEIERETPPQQKNDSEEFNFVKLKRR